MKKKINWLDHFANLFVVILGITIAFYLEEYRTSVANVKAEKKYLQALLTDLQADHDALDTLMGYNETMIRSINWLSSASIGRPYNADSLMWSVLSIQYNPRFSAQRATYESMKATGKLELIANFDLRNKIVELYEQYYRGAGEYDATINEHVSDFVKPYYMREIRYESAGKLDPAFLDADEFRNVIFAYRYLFDAKNDFYGLVKKQVEEIRVEIETHLGTKSTS